MTRSITIRAIRHDLVAVRAMGGGRSRLIVADENSGRLYTVDRDQSGRYGPIQPANQLRHRPDPGADPAPMLQFAE